MTERSEHEDLREKAADSMLALAADMNAGLLNHADAYYAVENFARWGTPYEAASGRRPE